MRLSLALACCCALLGAAIAAVYTEEELGVYLAGDFERDASLQCFNLVEAEWNYNTDLLNTTKEDALNAQYVIFAQFEKDQWTEYFRDADWENFQDELIKRQVQFLSVLGTAALEDAQLAELNGAINRMSSTYSTAKLCPYTNQNCDLATEGMDLDPGMEGVIATSTDYDELSYVWKGWRDASGAKMRDDYKTYVNLSNQAAIANGFADMGEMWRADYESPTFVQDMATLWAQVEPLYVSLHKFVRAKLVTRYGALMGTDETVIPASVLGNMWAQSWVNLYDLVIPYPNASPVDVTGALVEQGYDALRMFETSDEFYLSLGMFKNDMSYNVSGGAMIERPTDREVVCHASAWDFCDRETFRIKMCTKINSEDFITIHHEMGHIQYYQQYKDQPIVLRKGANPGFHEAVGDTIALSVSTPQHLEKIGLLANYTADSEADINALMLSALEKIAFLPFGYLIDQWRWDVFSGAAQESEWNAHWWRLRESIQRVQAPVARSEADFDPGSKYHVAADSQYIAYFVAHILQYQMHKAACIAAGQYNPDDVNTQPLYKCDIYQSVEAGNLLAEGLKLGGSKHWSEALFVMTGETELNGSALLEFYAPLKEYLDNNTP